MEQNATARYIRVTPRKMRLVSDLIRGLTVNEAEAQLLHERRRAAKILLKLLRSAASGARDTKKTTAPETLFVASIRVDKGPMLKRSLPRARGMATPIHKVMSHITLTLSDRPGAPAARFKIALQKKAKLPSEARPKAKKEKPAGEEREKPRPDRQPGFFKKMFRRKSV